MKNKYVYKNLKDTVIQLQNQAIESIPYCQEITDGINDPETLFNYLKTITTYKNDPPGIELIHTPESLFEKNFHGDPGAGDCDDFTALSIACLHCINLRPYVVLAGNQKDHPTHVYAGFIRTRFYDFDLTQTFYDTERKYKFRQFLKTRL